MVQESTSKYAEIIVGMGATGWSIARFLSHQGTLFKMFDEDATEVEQLKFKQAFPQAELKLGALEAQDFLGSTRALVSPGVSLKHDAIQSAMKAGCQFISDIELFAHSVDPSQGVVGITGTNGKSTVTCLFAHMAQQASVHVAKGGNLGPPALDLLLDHPRAELYVLELSNFQLEATESLHLSAATILNISEDHSDHYRSIAEYINAKQRIYRKADVRIVNRLEQFNNETHSAATGITADISFGLDAGEDGHFGVIVHQGEEWIARGHEAWIACSEVPYLHSKIGKLNAQAALALGVALHLPKQEMLQALNTFECLPHRMESVGCVHGIKWINDSKATNVAAAMAAMEMITKPCIWLAGGDSKGADFGPLKFNVYKNIRAVVLFGKSAQAIASSIRSHVSDSIVEIVSDLDAAVHKAMELAQAGDCLLLSPACSSLDQYANYAERGQHFKNLFEEFQCTAG